MRYRPYLKANLWHDFDSDNIVRFNELPITTTIDGTALELGAGLIAELDETVSLFANADYTTDMGGERQRVFEGNLGFSIKW